MINPPHGWECPNCRKENMIGTKEKLHVAIVENELDTADKILKEFAIRWFVFGMGLGGVVALALFGFLRIKIG